MPSGRGFNFCGHVLIFHLSPCFIAGIVGRRGRSINTGALHVNVRCEEEVWEKETADLDRWTGPSSVRSPAREARRRTIRDQAKSAVTNFKEGVKEAREAGRKGGQTRPRTKEPQADATVIES